MRLKYLYKKHNENKYNVYKPHQYGSIATDMHATRRSGGTVTFIFKLGSRRR